MNSAAIIQSLESVTAKWTKQRKREERGRAQSRRDALIRPSRVCITHVADRIIPEAYAKTSDGGRLPVSARQLYYAARGPIMEATGRTNLDSQYFCQNVLPAFMVSHLKTTQNWDVTYDARGHFAEPHTEIIVPLGTLDVRSYLADVQEQAVKRLSADDFFDDRIRRFPTCGPENRFGAVLFIEKEGFMPLFAATKLAERYDLAIMSTKGQTVVACRRLADKLCGPYGIPLLVLHDFDKAGFSILGTLKGADNYWKNNRVPRYEYQHSFDVLDFGVRLEDVEKYKLESEPVQYKKSDPRLNLKANGATPEELDFLCGGERHRSGRRVELNAFTSAVFIEWIESKLKANGIEKVIPDAETLETAYRRAVQVELIREQLDAVLKTTKQQAAEAKLPGKLDALVRKGFNADPTKSWDQVIGTVAAANCKKRSTRKK